jgi:hypothetical protein
MASIYEALDPRRPGTHALVIGVGHYHHLPAGGRACYDEAVGLTQLTSPPASARAFAEFMQRDYTNPDKPLRSLELLVSEPAGAAALEAASFDATRRAIDAWAFERSRHPEDLLVFFFSGHGLSRGAQTTLLLDDFGARPLAPLENAIDFTALHLGLEQAAAREQCFFVDACRASTSFITRLDRDTGQAVIAPLASHTNGPRRAPVYYATLPGANAYGRPGRPSLFTEALLRALAGPGSDDNDGNWRVRTDALSSGLNQVLRRVAAAAGVEERVPAAVDHLTPFVLHHLPDVPRDVPVDVICEPMERSANVRLSCEGLAARHERAPAAGIWNLDLDAGPYAFGAHGQAGQRRREVDVRPPFRAVRLEVP